MYPTREDIPEYDFHQVLTRYNEGSRAPFGRRRQILMDMVRRVRSDAPALEQEIAEIQVRLGTPDERPGDLDRANAVAHRLTNIMCIAMLMGDVERRLATSGSQPPILS